MIERLKYAQNYEKCPEFAQKRAKKSKIIALKNRNFQIFQKF